MIGKFNLSIIITFYKRKEEVNKIIQELINQSLKSMQLEIIISGHEKVNMKKIKPKNLNSNIQIRYIKNKKNSNALKRNSGYKAAKYQNIVFIDDDCLPLKNFLIDYLEIFKKLNKNEIVCGSVLHQQKLNNKNFYRYRQSRHYILKKKQFNFNRKLSASKIVTMNMGLKKTKYLSGLMLFDERFGKYGFEDYEFGFRFLKNGFKIIPSHPSVLHMDSRSFNKYLNKIYFLSTKSVNILKKISNEAWKQSNYYKLEKSLLFKILTGFKSFYIFLTLAQSLMVLIERISIIYLPQTIRLGIFLSYCRGYCDRKKNKSKKYAWYK